MRNVFTRKLFNKQYFLRALTVPTYLMKAKLKLFKQYNFITFKQHVFKILQNIK